MGVSPPRVTAPPPAWLAETRLPVTSESVGRCCAPRGGRRVGSSAAGLRTHTRIPVTTSGRRESRTAGGFADHLRGLTGT